MTAAILALVAWLVVRDLARYPLRRPRWSWCERHGPSGYRCDRWRWHRGSHRCGDSKAGFHWRDGWKGWGGRNVERRGAGTWWTNYTDPEALPYGGPEQDSGRRG